MNSHGSGLLRKCAAMRVHIASCLLGLRLNGNPLTGIARAHQSLSRQCQTPEVASYEGTRVWSGLAKKYLPTSQPHTTFVNSSRLESLMRAGNIYLSLQDAIALALENNLDIEYHRYDRRQAETDQLRASAGQLLRFNSNPTRPGFNSASSGVLAGLGAVGGSSGTAGWNSRTVRRL